MISRKCIPPLTGSFWRGIGNNSRLLEKLITSKSFYELYKKTEEWYIHFTQNL